MLRWVGVGFVVLALVLVGTIMTRSVGQGLGQSRSQSLQSALPTVASAQPVYTIRDLPNSLVHLLKIPASTIPAATAEFSLVPQLADQTASLEEFSQRYDALAVLNGGFFDPQNHQTTSYVMQQGQWVGDPRQNARLMQNPDLTPYLDQILDRSELRRYRCSNPDRIQFAIARHRAPLPAGCDLLDALGAGPQLLPELTLEAEGFTARDSRGEVIRDALGSNQPNARTAVGILPDGSLLWVMAAQKPGLAASGLTLPELADFLRTEGAEAALNLDGGSSSGLVYQGKPIYGKLDQDGNPVIRSVKSVLLLQR
ncbi:MAG: phosphodiester glycosidase family protein [Elainella sp.]